MRERASSATHTLTHSHSMPAAPQINWKCGRRAYKAQQVRELSNWLARPEGPPPPPPPTCEASWAFPPTHRCQFTDPSPSPPLLPCSLQFTMPCASASFSISISTWW